MDSEFLWFVAWSFLLNWCRRFPCRIQSYFHCVLKDSYSWHRQCWILTSENGQLQRLCSIIGSWPAPFPEFQMSSQLGLFITPVDPKYQGDLEKLFYLKNVQKLTQQKGGSKMQELAGSESKLHHATCNNCTSSASLHFPNIKFYSWIFIISIKDDCCENKPI